MQQQPVPDQAAVDERENGIPVAFLDLRAGNKAGEAKDAAGRIVRLAAVFGNGFGRRNRRRWQQQLPLAVSEIHQFVERLASEYLIDALPQRRRPV